MGGLRGPHVIDYNGSLPLQQYQVHNVHSPRNAPRILVAFTKYHIALRLQDHNPQPGQIMVSLWL